MRCRALDANGDYTFGRSQGNFLVNSPTLVGQLVLTRLKLLQGEWFLDETIGTPWNQVILGYGTKAARDAAVRTQVLNTPGVTGIATFSSVQDNATRGYSVAMLLNTQFGQITVQADL